MDMTGVHDINPRALQEITPGQAWHYAVVPIDTSDTLITLLAAESLSGSGMDELELLTGKRVSVVRQPAETIEGLLCRHYPQDHPDLRKQDAFYTGNPEQFLTHMISEAKSLKSSDIHIEAFEESCRVRIRIDGMLLQRYLLDKKQYPSIINKIKIIANLDIAEKRLPQDGRIFFSHNDEKFDIRASVLPTLHGEKIVLRLLNNNTAGIDLLQLGLHADELSSYLESIRRPNGMILISGPTGSGKTTTLYATLRILNKQTRNILTIEDPIEYTLEGINQVQLRENIGLSFSAALRTFLRQDPDIIMLGEIRDADTANMAIRTALTGHLVLSTVHTNSAWGIISRLADMGMPAFLIANTLNTVVAQRLVRLLCPDCKKKQPQPAMYPPNFTPPRRPAEHFTATGCSHCYNTGYRGRKGIYEVIPIDRELSEQIKKSNYDVQQLLKEKGFRSLAENAFELFEQHLTSLEEIYPILIN